MNKTAPLRLCLCFGLVLAATACTPPLSEWTESETPKQLRVDYLRMEHRADFVPGTAQLADGEAARLDDFIENAEVTPDDHIYFQAGSDDKLTAQRVSRLTQQIAERGLGATTLRPAANIPADRMLVLVERYVVTPPNCPDWTQPGVDGHANNLPSNFGCADLTNLGLMVADPRDLLFGRTLGPAMGYPAVAGYEAYRSGKPKQPSATGASNTYNFSVFGNGGNTGAAQ